MELKVNEITIPERIVFNYEELKAELAERVQMYETLVYTDDDIKQAKTDKANLNKLKKALNDERIRLEREYMEPFNEFKKQVDDLGITLDKAIVNIDSQVKAYEDKKREEKADLISEIWNSIEKPDWLDFGAIYNDRWLNVTYSLKQIGQEISNAIIKVNNDLLTLREMHEFSFEAIEEYKRTLDINKAITEGVRLSEMQKRKQEAERKTLAITEPDNMKEITIEQPQKFGSWINFRAFLTVSQAAELKDFFNRRNIEFRRIP